MLRWGRCSLLATICSLCQAFQTVRGMPTQSPDPMTVTKTNPSPSLKTLPMTEKTRIARIQVIVTILSGLSFKKPLNMVAVPVDSAQAIGPSVRVVGEWIGVSRGYEQGVRQQSAATASPRMPTVVRTNVV